MSPIINSTDTHDANEFIVQIYERYNKQMIGYAYKITHDIILTQDIVNSVFLIIINKIEKLRQMSDNEIAPYIFTIVRNESLHRIKVHEREITYEFVDEITVSDFNVEKHVIETIEIGAMKKALSDLPERFRMAIILKYWMQLSHKEIAKEMHISESYSQNLLAKAITSLRKRLSEVIEIEKY